MVYNTSVASIGCLFMLKELAIGGQVEQTKQEYQQCGTHDGNWSRHCGGRHNTSTG